MDRREQIKTGIAYTVTQGLGGLVDILRRPETLDVLAQAHDAEDCAQRGEPDPWCDWMVREHIEQNGQAAHDEWVAERRAAMLAALRAVGLA
jgi:hypothetical protein